MSLVYRDLRLNLGSLGKGKNLNACHVKKGICAFPIDRVPDARGQSQDLGFSHQSFTHRGFDSEVVVRGQLEPRETNARQDHQTRDLGCRCKQYLFNKPTNMTCVAFLGIEGHCPSFREH
jgi:hypothetical protein